MKNVWKLGLFTFCILWSQVQASIFLEYMNLFLVNSTYDNWMQLFVWQLAGLVVPLLAGPCRVASLAFFTVEQEVNGITMDTTVLQAYFYVEYQI